LGQKMDVRGQVRALRWSDGASGVLSGSLAGLYEAFRWGDDDTGQSTFVLELASGDLAVEVTVLDADNASLPPRPDQHPFAGGRNPVRARRAIRTCMPRMEAETSTGAVTLTVLPEASSGIFAGARGEIELTVPNYRAGGSLVVHTESGNLWLDYVELCAAGATLQTDLWVDGARSTGPWRGAGGKLRFRLELHQPNVAVGWYAGTFRLGPAIDASLNRTLAPRLR
jgi:hypothetical protein